MSDSKPRRKLAAILAADVVNFSAMMGENEDRTLRNLKACRVLTDECITANHGRVFGSAGDSIIAEFASPVDAVVAATEFQRSLRQRNEGVAEDDQMEFRVGLNLGDVIVEGENLYGDGVNVAARLEELAEPGGISLSGKFHEEVCKKLDMSFVSTGEQEMKNIRTPVLIYKIEISELSKLNTDSSGAGLSHNEESGYGQLKAGVTDNKPPSIAVIPFANMSGDSEQDYFVDGITEDIITNLSLWRTFPVISRNSSFTYKDKSVNVKDVAEELGVRYIVEGSVRKGGQRVRITAQLIDAEQDHHLWSEKWDRSLEDIFDVQDEVSASIAAQVNPTLEDYERDRIERSRPVNFNAWETYLKSLHSFNERDPLDHEDSQLKEARSLCERAIELDPSMSHAYSLLSQIGVSELLQLTTDDSGKTLDEILLNAKKAAELDSKNPIAAESIATYYFFSGKFEESRQYSMRAIKLNPSYPEAQNRLGQSLVHSGQYAESEKHFRKAIELNPLDSNAIVYKDGLFFAQMGLENFEGAHDLIEECILQFPNTGFYRGFRASVKGHLDKGEEAKLALDTYLKLRPNLKTRADYKKIFVPNSSLADILIEGLIKAGWQPEGG